MHQNDKYKNWTHEDASTALVTKLWLKPEIEKQLKKQNIKINLLLLLSLLN